MSQLHSLKIISGSDRRVAGPRERTDEAKGTSLQRGKDRFLPALN